METLYLNEMLRILFYSYQKSPSQFTSLFNDSKSIAAFDFDIKNNEFVRLSHSFNSFLGIDEFLCGIKDILLKEIIHPNDITKFKEYFNIHPFLNHSLNGGNFSVFKRMKCRFRHSKGHWKYFIITSFNHMQTNSRYIHKIGFIVDEKINPGYFLSEKDDTHFISENTPNNNDLLHITKRENEVLEYIGKGMIAKEIAAKLNISVTTVISHRKNLIEKFHVKNTAELVKEASKLMII